jgi:hypothetical protein
MPLSTLRSLLFTFAAFLTINFVFTAAATVPVFGAPATTGGPVIRTATPDACDRTFTDPNKPPCIQALGVVFQNILNVVMGLAGFAAFAFLIFGGFKYLTSQGDPKALGAARTTISWALGGLAMIIISYLIILLISNYTGIQQLQKFEIPSPGATR